MSAGYTPILSRGVVIPPLILPDLDGRRVSRNSYRGKKHLALVFLAASVAAEAYLQALATIDLASVSGEVLVIVRSHDQDELRLLSQRVSVAFPLLYDRDGVTTARFLPMSAGAGVFITDRYGELYYQALADSPDDLPAVSEVVAWLEAIDNQCSI